MHLPRTVLFAIFLIFSGAAILSTLVLFARQSLLIAYILLGILFGPWGFKLVSNVSFIKETGEIGIIFLLFLLGLELRPQSLWKMFRKTIPTALISSLLFAIIGYITGMLLGYHPMGCLVIGLAMMFSSTIIGIKLLPMTVLQHRHTGELMVSILLMQDLIAILVLVGLHVVHIDSSSWLRIGSTFIALPALILITYFAQRFILMKIIWRFGHIHEYVFLLSIGWCLAISQLAVFLGLSDGIGAFIAGVTIATNPISRHIEKNLEPIRDFFLVMFFFYIGLSFNFNYLHLIIIPAIILSIIILTLKPLIFRLLLLRLKERKHIAWEVGARLGQISEFSLLIVYLASNIKLISHSVSYLVQATTIITFITSSYFVMLRYPTPINLIKGDYHETK